MKMLAEVYRSDITPCVSNIEYCWNCRRVGSSLPRPSLPGRGREEEGGRLTPWWKTNWIDRTNLIMLLYISVYVLSYQILCSYCTSLNNCNISTKALMFCSYYCRQWLSPWHHIKQAVQPEVWYGSCNKPPCRIWYTHISQWTQKRTNTRWLSDHSLQDQWVSSTSCNAYSSFISWAYLLTCIRSGYLPCSMFAHPMIDHTAWFMISE